MVFFLIIMSGVSAYGTSDSVVYRIERSYQLVNNSSNDADNVNLTFYALDNHDIWADQHIFSENIASGFSKEISSTVDNRVVNVKVGKVESESRVTVNTSYLIGVDTFRMNLKPEDVQEEVPLRYLKYTKPVPNLWQSDDPRIENKARELTKGLTNDYSKVKKIIEFVDNHFSYRVQAEEHDALWAYESDVGDCAEYTNLFVALTRSVGIPTKAVSGFLPFTELYGQEVNDLSQIGHQFAIVYLPQSGWVPVDLTYRIDGRPQFGSLANNHIVVFSSDGGNWVENSNISVPSAKTSYSYRVADPKLSVICSGSLTKEVAVEEEILSPIKDYPAKLKISVKVTNLGTQGVDNLRIGLVADNDYFVAPPVKKIKNISSGTYRVFRFELEKLKSAENELLEIFTFFDTRDYGSFRSSNQVYISTTVSSSPSFNWPEFFKEVFEKYYYPLLIVLGLLVIASVIAICRWGFNRTSTKRKVGQNARISRHHSRAQI